MAGALAALLALLVYVMWSWLVLYVRWNGREPVDWLVYGNAYTGPVLTLLLLVSLLLAVVAGRFTGFLNLSTLQPFYAARLTRAYLGASNGERFAAHAGGQEARERFSVAEPVPGDQLTLNTYYDPRVLAPLHLINVTLNQTLDPAEQLVQRDRKGKPLCLGPGPSVVQPGPAQTLPPDAYARFLVDGRQCCPDLSRPRTARLSESRTVGDWIAISGATMSTGLGAPRRWGPRCCLGSPICVSARGGRPTCMTARATRAPCLPCSASPSAPRILCSPASARCSARSIAWAANWPRASMACGAAGSTCRMAAISITPACTNCCGRAATYR